MSTKVNVKGCSRYHLSSFDRSRLVRLSFVLEHLLDQDARFGFKPDDDISWIYPYFFRVLSALYTKRFRLVRKSFHYLGGCDVPHFSVSRDFYEEALSLMGRLDSTVSSDNLPF